MLYWNVVASTFGFSSTVFDGNIHINHSEFAGFLMMVCVNEYLDCSRIFSAFWFRMTMPPRCWEIFTYKKQSVIREHDYKLKTSHRVIKVWIVWYYLWLYNVVSFRISLRWGTLTSTLLLADEERRWLHCAAASCDFKLVHNDINILNMYLLLYNILYNNILWYYMVVYFWLMSILCISSLRISRCWCVMAGLGRIGSYRQASHEIIWFKKVNSNL